MSSAFTIISVLIWVALGAIVGAFAAMLALGSDAGDAYAPYAELLGKPCWVNEGGERSKFRVVAVSHKGSVAVRRWEDGSGKRAKWVRREDIEKGDRVCFDEGELR